MPGVVVQNFAKAFASRDIRKLEPYLAEHVAARFEITGELVGKSALLGFWRRLFQSYSLVELHVLKCVAQEGLVIAENFYLLASRRGVIDVRSISIFEVEHGMITRWSDHSDLAAVPVSEKKRLRRLSADRW